jgi:hypothetical protein
MKIDNIEVIFTDDGKIKIITDPISQPNHTNADKFIKAIAQLMGGGVVYEKRTDGTHRHGEHSHSHDHGGEHSHD